MFTSIIRFWPIYHAGCASHLVRALQSIYEHITYMNHIISCIGDISYIYIHKYIYIYTYAYIIYTYAYIYIHTYITGGISHLRSGPPLPPLHAFPRFHQALYRIRLPSALPSAAANEAPLTSEIPINGHLEVSMAMGVPESGWFLLGKMPSRNGWFRGTPISGNLHFRNWLIGGTYHI